MDIFHPQCGIVVDTFSGTRATALAVVAKFQNSMVLEKNPPCFQDAQKRILMYKIESAQDTKAQ